MNVNINLCPVYSPKVQRKSYQPSFGGFWSEVNRPKPTCEELKKMVEKINSYKKVGAELNNQGNLLIFDRNTGKKYTSVSWPRDIDRKNYKFYVMVTNNLNKRKPSFGEIEFSLDAKPKKADVEKFNALLENLSTFTEENFKLSSLATALEFCPNVSYKSLSYYA